MPFMTSLQSPRGGNKESTFPSNPLLTAFLLAAIFLLPISASAAPLDDYETAIELARDYRYAQAVPLLRTAAEQGDLRAQRTLAQMLFHGESVYGSDVRRDHAEAAYWFRLAAEQGCVVSSHYLSRHQSLMATR
jgi:TPR repeat protein